MSLLPSSPFFSLLVLAAVYSAPLEEGMGGTGDEVSGSSPPIPPSSSLPTLWHVPPSLECLWGVLLCHSVPHTPWCDRAFPLLSFLLSLCPLLLLSPISLSPWMSCSAFSLLEHLPSVRPPRPWLSPDQCNLDCNWLCFIILQVALKEIIHPTWEGYGSKNKINPSTRLAIYV